jgi:hypothetical protein
MTDHGARRLSGSSARRIATLELAARRSTRRGPIGMTVRVNNVSHVKTIDRVAKEFDVVVEAR